MPIGLTARRDADLFQRALQGEPLPERSAELATLAALAASMPRPRVAPDEQFVARLRADLVARAERRPLPGPARPPADGAARGSGADRAGRPRTIVLPTPRPRPALAGLAAVAVVLALAVGGLSTRSLPGDRLYPVKLMIGQAQVRLASDAVGRGRALLGQVGDRLDEAAALVGTGDPPPARVDEALTRAGSDLQAAQRELLAVAPGTGDPEALRVLADGTSEDTGRLQALRARVPTASVAAVDHLLALLAQGRSALLQQVTRCGAPCAGVVSRLGPGATTPARGRDPAGTATTAPVLPSSQGQAPGPAAPSSLAPPGVANPTAVPTAPPPTTAPPRSGGSASVPGVSVSGPGFSVSVPGPGVPVPTTTTPTASLPELSVPGVSVPGVSVPPGGVRVGPATVSVPGVPLGTRVCAAGRCLL